MVSSNTSTAVERAIQLNQDDRFSDAAAYKAAISDSATLEKPDRTPGRNRWILLLGGLALGAAVIICLLAVGYFVVWPLVESTDTPTSTSSPTTQLTSPSAQTGTPASPTETQSSTVQPSPTSSEAQIEDGFGVQMVLVPAGSFEMGTNFGGEEESPAHTVTLDGYYIDLNEVTNAHYDACVQAGSCNPPLNLSSATRSSYYGVSNYDDFPVIHVNWDMANNYCEWRGARLPTEAEWEKAARGSIEGIYPWGMDIDCSWANYWDGQDDCVGDTTAVGSYPQGASSIGLMDMAGNVWEWVMDWYDPGYYAKSPSENPSGPDTGQHRVMRGGSWSGGALQLRVTTRGRNLPTGAYNYVGFRCARSP